MRPSPEQKARLDQIFGDWDPLANIELEGKSSVWEVIKKENKGNFTKGQEYLLAAGPVQFELSVGFGLSSLNWEAKIPEYLKSGRGVEGYSEFIAFILNKFPSMFYNLPGPYSDTYNNYLRNSSITIDPSSSDERKNFELKKEKDRINLALNLFSDTNKVRTIAVILKPEYADRFGECHLFVTYPDKTGGGAEISIGLPTSSITTDCWGENVMMWALESHPKNKKIEDLTIASRNLSDKVSSILKND